MLRSKWLRKFPKVCKLTLWFVTPANDMVFLIFFHFFFSFYLFSFSCCSVLLRQNDSVPSITINGNFCSSNYMFPTPLISAYFLLLQFSTHDVVVLKPNKADLGSPSLGQGVVYRLKVRFTSNIGLSFIYLLLWYGRFSFSLLVFLI